MGLSGHAFYVRITTKIVMHTRRHTSWHLMPIHGQSLVLGCNPHRIEMAVDLSNFLFSAVASTASTSR